MGIPPSQLGCALGSLGQSVARLKISGRSTRNGRNVISRKISTLVGQYEPTELFCLWTKVHQIFFAQRPKGLWLITFFSDVRYVDPFRRYLRSKSNVVKNRAKILTFFWPSQFFWGQVFQKLYARYHPCIGARRLEKFCEDTPTSPEVIEAHTLNFRPDF